MAAAFLLAAFGASRVAAQMEHSNSAFAYMGCSSVDLSCFGSPIVFPDGHVTPEACQDACHGHQFAALLPGACHCGDDASGITAIDENFCNTACMGDPAFGTCGGFDQDQGGSIANVYDWPASPGQEHGLVTSQTVHTVSLPAPATESPCSTFEHMPSAPPTAATLLTPIGSAPEAPAFSSTYLSDELPPSAPAFPHTSQASEAWTTSCSQHDRLVTEVPTPPEPSHASTKGPNPPDYSSDGEARPTPGCGDIGGPDDVDCTPTRPAELSEVPSQRTLWPAAPYASAPTLETHIPSQVPENDAPQDLIPAFSAFGGLALIAAMIM
ncbi:WSC domain-containing protein [Hirsutella rhossiliensis]|uniref:WSC domain-containing protein n=1 Tax=Hirsutella rhossiliensis TaxID=111463 RepID=A0A9P8N3Q4_9HYPO|nr:WSC domain-containing protein [Hirsutella rhossiliensis]KAH0966022.1 WSC domain-containing protein [Hirsutella rhossiliensis]